MTLKDWKFPACIAIAALTVAVAGFAASRSGHPDVSAPTPTMPDAVTPSATATPMTLSIPDLGILAPIVESEGPTEAQYQKALQRGVVRYPGTPEPGRPGNAYLFGHSSDYPWAAGSYKRIFARLPDIALGTRIIASDAAGVPHAYVATSTKVVRPSDLSVLAQDPSRSLLTLQTSYPLGTAFRRFIVVAELER